MRQEIEAFFLLAPDLGLLTGRQAVILREIATDDIGLDDFVGLMVTCGLVSDEQDVRAIVMRVASEIQDERAARSAPVPAKTWDVQPELDWFCHLAVSEGLLTEETCLGLLSSFEDATELMSLAQFLVTAGICDDVLKIQDLVDRATEAGQAGSRPPQSIFQTSP